MKIGILTFQFAHNYGALLQAYSLKIYLTQIGANVEFIPYYPIRFQKEYEISPFGEGLTVKQRISRIIKYRMKKASYDRFKLFKENELEVRNSISNIEFLSQYLNNFDCIIFGSDQIWNTELTNDDLFYFGKDINNKKIAYAASIGTEKITQKQREAIKRYLSDFVAISVREDKSGKIIRNLVNRQCCVTVDPVFLLSPEQWNGCMAEIKTKRPYMIFYTLEENVDLTEYAKKYAAIHDLDIYEIHPIRENKHKEFYQLADVGPKEFVGLIRNAEIVCTNSFHAVSFSMIYGKKCLHIPNLKSPIRTISLLHSVGLEPIESNKMPIYEFNEAILEKMNPQIKFSKKFLQDGISK